jgi:hypothetical protein
MWHFIFEAAPKDRPVVLAVLGEDGCLALDFPCRSGDDGRCINATSGRSVDVRPTQWGESAPASRLATARPARVNAAGPELLVHAPSTDHPAWQAGERPITVSVGIDPVKDPAVSKQIGPVAPKIAQVSPNIGKPASSQVSANVAPIGSDIATVRAQIRAGEGMSKRKAVSKQIGPIAPKIAQVSPNAGKPASPEVRANVAPIRSDIATVPAQIRAGKPHGRESSRVEPG